MRRHALVTGATGFVGSHLVERLSSQGWEVRALVRPTSDTRLLQRLGVELEQGDLADAEAIRRASEGVEVVYHLAAATFARSAEAFAQANEEGSRTLVEGISRAEPRPRRLVYLSSYAACGPSRPGQPRRMQDPPAPLTAYGRTKLAGERAVREMEQRGVEVVILRAPAVYGPGDRALLSYFRLVRWGLAPSPEGGAERLHVIFAPDLARALERAADGPPGTLAVAEPREHSWAELVDAIASAQGRRPLRLELPAPLVRAAARATQLAGGLIGRAVPFNREKAEEMLAPAWVCELAGSEGLLPAEDATPLSDGIAETVRWYKRQGWL